MLNLRRWMILLSTFFMPFSTSFAEMTPLLDKTPIHEAFISKISAIVPIEVIAKEPPAPLADPIPPQQGSDTRWIPGYWSWNRGANDFVWVSGVWRKFPPETTWVPGTWRVYNGGYAWIPGFFTKTPFDKIPFVNTAPPEAIEESVEIKEGSDSFWVSGHFEYSKEAGQWEWYKGTLQAFDPDWILIPAHVIWRPEGFALLEAYWDFPLEKRGTAYSSANPPTQIDSQTILRRLFLEYPDYLSVFAHSWHFKSDLWKDCSCVPSWWYSDSWWSFSWNNQWSLWWWFGHPGFPHPVWLDMSLSQKILPANETLLTLLKKKVSPIFISSNGIPESAAWLKVIQKVQKAKKQTPLLPLDPKLKEQIDEMVKNSLTPQQEVLTPAAKTLLPNILKPLFKTPSESAKGTIKVPPSPGVKNVSASEKKLAEEIADASIPHAPSQPAPIPHNPIPHNPIPNNSIEHKPIESISTPPTPIEPIPMPKAPIEPNPITPAPIEPIAMNTDMIEDKEIEYVERPIEEMPQVEVPQVEVSQEPAQTAESEWSATPTIRIYAPPTVPPGQVRARFQTKR